MGEQGGFPRGQVGQSKSPAQSGDSRISLKDIANELGISQTAVSFAVNDKPGVSQETKRRVRDVATRMGWSPAYAAQALGTSRTMTVGFAPARSMDAFQTENFMLHFMAGIHASLSRLGYGLLFRPCATLAEELETYRDWARRKRVDGVILVDLLADDPRPRLIHDLGLPAVLAGGPDSDNYLPSLSIDDTKTMTTIMRHLSSLGHSRIAYLSGDGNLDYSRARASSFEAFVRKEGLGAPAVEFTDFDPDRAAGLTYRLSSGPEPYTAFIYENEILAAASLRFLLARGMGLPGCGTKARPQPPGGQALSQNRSTGLPAMVSFEDSFICQSTYPTITSVHRDAGLYGTKVANLLLKIFRGGEVSGNRRILTPKLVIRESTSLVGIPG
ncbi:LacI family DNA-binding transcriptional regulator [uncultured Bifidobacterium sp.]|uniref:LacI family DNA-binding transcriptional regulator n=1 Tax=uncultured Bifidobacterium sp. TaxID=165187 RepID=UPI00262A6CF6|nr:LacI family DNA-binding transcriptional regulator [uncultured Bifidobacterium sp.]